MKGLFNDSYHISCNAPKINTCLLHHAFNYNMAWLSWWQNIYIYIYISKKLFVHAALFHTVKNDGLLTIVFVLIAFRLQNRSCVCVNYDDEKMCRNHQLLLVSELLFCTNPKSIVSEKGAKAAEIKYLFTKHIINCQSLSFQLISMLHYRFTLLY